MTPSRCALVTGAARGIGAAIATRFADQGASVGLVDLDADGLEGTRQRIASAGGRAHVVAADITDEVASAAAVSEIAEVLGPPTILVNNAGITRDDLLFRMTLDDWEAVTAVHLRGAFLMTRATQAHMTAATWGRIVNLSSVSALGRRGQANYAAAKAGLQGFTKSLAFELGPFGVTVNAVAPGFIETEMTAATAERMGMSFEELKRASAEQTPVRRVGQPEDVAAAVAWFASDEASFVTGQVLYVAGGPRG